MKTIAFNLKEEDRLEAFYSLSELLYKDNPQYIRQTNLIDKDAFESGFMLLNDEKVLARIVLYRSQIRMEGKRVLFLGNFEAVTEEDGVFFLKSIHTILEKFLSGMILIGPVNGSTWNNYRLSTGENSYLFPNDVVNAPYYSDIFERAGFSLYTQYYTQVQTSFDTDLKTPAGYTIQYLSREGWVRSLEIIYGITMEAFAGAPLFSSITFEAFREKYMQLLESLNTDLMPLVLDEKKEIVGYAVAYLSPFDKSMTAKTIARKTGMRYAGVGRLLSSEIMELARKYKVDRLYHAFMHEENNSKTLSDKYNALPVKYYRLYKMDISGNANEMDGNANIVRHFFAQADLRPHTFALCQGDKMLTYAQLLHLVKSFQEKFRNRGIVKHKRILVLHPLTIEMYASLLALLANGCTLVFVEEWTSLKDIKAALGTVACDAILCTPKVRLMSMLFPSFRSLKWLTTKVETVLTDGQSRIALVGKDDEAIISFSSGTSGVSKAVVRTHGIVNAQFAALKEHIMVKDNARMCTNFPVVILMNLGLGIDSYMAASLKISKLAETDFSDLADEIKKRHVTHLSFSPFVLNGLSKAFEKTVKFQQVICGGAALFPSRISEILERVEADNFLLLYGSSEAEPIAYCSFEKALANAGENGLFAGNVDANTRVKIMRTENKKIELCGIGEPGEIIVSGHHVVKNYIGSELAYQQNKILLDGEIWHRTGDCGYFNIAGCLVLTGPLKYIQHGIFLSEIEKQLAAISGILSGTIIDEIAYIQVNEKRKQAHTGKSILALYPWVKQIVFKDLPLDKRHNGKIKYKLLKK